MTGTDMKHDGTERVVCELDPSMPPEQRIIDAVAACEQHNADLYVVWVIDPAAGAFGLPALLGTAIALAAERGIRATSAVRFGTREVVLREPGNRRVGPSAADIDRRTPHPPRLRRSPQVKSNEGRRRR